MLNSMTRPMIALPDPLRSLLRTSGAIRRSSDPLLELLCHSWNDVAVCNVRSSEGGWAGNGYFVVRRTPHCGDGRTVALSWQTVMSSRASRVWLLLPVTIFAIIALTVGLVATGTVPEPYATPFFHLFFRGVLQMKAWLATAALVLACGQLLTAARIYELLRFPPKGRLYHALHRWSGRMAILLTLPVAYHCILCWDSAPTAPAPSSTRCWGRPSTEPSSRKCSSSDRAGSQLGYFRWQEVFCSRSFSGCGLLRRSCSLPVLSRPRDRGATPNERPN